jgi:hypothetical protein
MSPSRAWGKNYIPKLELGNEKKLVGRASTATGKTFQDRINVAGTEARPSGLFMIYGYPRATSWRHRKNSAIDGGRRI